MVLDKRVALWQHCRQGKRKVIASNDQEEDRKEPR